MADVQKILNDDEFFGGTVHTPKESIDQDRNQECLKGAVRKGKAHLLGRTLILCSMFLISL